MRILDYFSAGHNGTFYTQKSVEHPRSELGMQAGLIKHGLRVIAVSCVTVLALLVGACAVGPNYQRPSEAELRTPVSWRAKLPHDGSVAGLAKWWENFDEPALTGLVVSAEENSPTIATAIARVREGRTFVRSARALFWPAMSGSGSLTRGKNVNGSAESVSDSSGSRVATVTSAAVDASWELDLFGGNRRNAQAARARLESVEADWHDARVTLAAEVANTFTSARQHRRLIVLYEQELISRRTSERLVALKVREGSAPIADSLLAEASTADAASLLQTERGMLEQACNQLVMLTGLTYAQVWSALATNDGIPRITTSLILGVPAKEIAQRPDVRSAERLLSAASADIGVAIADALPSLSLAGNIGVNSTRTDKQTSTLSSWSFGPRLNVPIFSAGAKAANIEGARAKYDQALAEYQSTVWKAVREIEDTFVRIDTLAHRLGCARRAAENYSAYFFATEQSYREGMSSLLELETARRQSHGAQESLLSVELDQAHAWIALYKALGGGWPASVAAATTGQ